MKEKEIIKKIEEIIKDKNFKNCDEKIIEISFLIQDEREREEEIINNEIIENNIELILKSLDFRKLEIENHLFEMNLSEKKEKKEELYHIKKLIEIYQKND